MPGSNARLYDREEGAWMRGWFMHASALGASPVTGMCESCRLQPVMPVASGERGPCEQRTQSASGYTRSGDKASVGEERAEGQKGGGVTHAGGGARREHF
jgi:hypothetical protein